MEDIIIYTTKVSLLHKQDKLEGDDDKSNCGRYYWTLSKTPKTIEKSERIYFATEGYIRGYFEIIDVCPSMNGGCEIEFESKSWTPIVEIPTKSFQGFKYAKNVSELNSEKADKTCATKHVIPPKSKDSGILPNFT